MYNKLCYLDRLKYNYYLYKYNKNGKYKNIKKLITILSKVDNSENQNKTEYDIFIPIGRGCHTAMMLNNIDLRKKSFPFDWISSSIRSVDVMSLEIDYIINDFNNFLNYEDLDFKDENSDKKYYFVYDKRSSLFFGHDFLKSKPIKEAYEEVYQKYKRRINRLYDYINKLDNICFVYMQNTWDQFYFSEIMIEDKIVELNLYKLRKRFPNKKIDIIIFQHANKRLLEYSFDKINESSYIYFSNHKYTKDSYKLGTILSIEKIFNDRYKLSDKFLGLEEKVAL